MSPSLLSPAFLALIAIVVMARALIPARYSLSVGLIGAMAAIGITSPNTLLTIGGVSLLYLYPVHLVLSRISKDEHARLRSICFGLAIAGLVGMMVAFKLYQRFSLPFSGVSSVGADAVALFGFSYFLFRAINFLYVHHALGSSEKQPWTLLYFSLFPSTLTSGPIQKYLDFRKQIATPQALTRADASEGLYRISRGYFRKICLAYVTNEVATAYVGLSELVAWQSVLIIIALYLFFYFDFAGYSDIAIGFGLLLGVRVPENFRQPFMATSLTEFWRHWHITLGDWLRDHVFIPLGGMRAGHLKGGALAALVMVLCGLWHGITWPFFMWGAWHGGHLLLESVMGLRPVPRGAARGARYWSLLGWTNMRVAFGALLFLPTLDDVAKVLKGFAP